MILFYFAIVITFISFFFKNSKIVFTFIFALMWFLFGLNYKNADYYMYETMYNIPLSNFIILKYEGGYAFLMYCCKYIGLNFFSFRFILSGILLSLVFRFFFIFSKLPAFAAICFFWILFPLQYVILRNFIAFAIVLQGLIAVLKNEKYCRAKYVFLVLLASTIHISSLVYFIFLLAFRKNEIKIKTIYLWVIGLLIFVMMTHNLVFSILSHLNKEKVIFYRTSWFLFIAYSLIQILNLYVLKYFLNLNNQFKKKNDNSNSEIIVLNMNIVMLLLIPIYYEMAVFVRILLNLSIVNIVFIINKSFIVEKNIFPKVLFLTYLLIWFFGFVFFVRENTIMALFSNNLLF